MPWIKKTTRQYKNEWVSSEKELTHSFVMLFLKNLRSNKVVYLEKLLSHTLHSLKKYLNELENTSVKQQVLDDARTLPLVFWLRVHSSSSSLDLPLHLEADLLSGLLSL